jgi:hypothetical protein
MALSDGTAYCQVPADSVLLSQQGSADDRNHNVTLTLPKKSPKGSTGQAVFVAGKLVSFTAPT